MEREISPGSDQPVDRGLKISVEDQKLIENNDDGDVNDNGGGDGFPMSVTLAQSGGTEVKRKRGRPRKESNHVEQQGMFGVSPDYSSPPKRGRGRPKGSGKWQGLDASLLGAQPEVSNLTPRVVNIQVGENIVERISLLSQRPSDSVCILSSSGIVSTTELLQPGSSDVVRRYEGQFQILSLAGSVSNKGTKQCRLTVQFAKPDGHIFGGTVAGSLIAGGPSKLIVGTFKQTTKPSKPKKDEEAAASIPLQTDNDELQNNEANSLDNVYRVSPLPVDEITAANAPEMNHDHLSHQPFDWNA